MSLAKHRDTASLRAAVVLGALTLAALALRLADLTRFELWVDEAATWHYARLAASGRLLEQVALEPTPPLYYLLVGLLMRAFGDSDLVMRLPSVVFGTAAVPAVFALARTLVGRRAGLLAAALVAVHPLHVFYSREARVYPLLLLASVVLWWTLAKALEGDRWRQWTLYGVVLLVACYCHFYGLFLGATAGVLILARRRWRGLVVSALVGLAFAPYLLLTLPHLRESGAAWSVELFYDKLPAEKRFGRALEMGFIGAGYHPFLRQVSQPPTPPLVRWASLLAQVALLVLAWAGTRRNAFVFLLAAWLLPLLVPWTINHWRAIFHTGRHDFYVVGTLCVLLGAGLDALFAGRGRRWAAVLVMAVLAFAAGQRLWALHRLPASDFERRTGAWLAEHATARDRVIAMGIRRLVSEHYTRLAGGEVTIESFPRSTDAHPGWSDVTTLLEDEAVLHTEAGERLAELERTLEDGATLFVLLRPYQRTATAVSADWLVDRHLLENLAAAGWRPVAGLENAELRIAVLRPEGI